MTIWQDIDRYRKSGEIEHITPTGARYVLGGREAKEMEPELEVCRFDEMEDEARARIERYLKTPASSITRELELKVCDAVLKYIIFNSHDLEKCGERPISKALGMPRGRLHSLLSKMEWDGIVTKVGIGPSSPYMVLNMGKALSEGYLSLSREDAEKLSMLGARMNSIRGMLRMAISPSLPEPVALTEASCLLWPYNKGEGFPMKLVLPAFNPGRAEYHFTPYRDHDIVQTYLRWPYGGLLHEVMMELGVPETITKEEAVAGLRRVAEKYLKLTRMTIRPLIDLIKGHGFEGAVGMVQKAFIRDELLKKERDDSGREIPRLEILKGSTSIVDMAVVPGHGLVTRQTNRLTPSHVRLANSVYRAALRFAESLEVDPTLVGECREEMEFLDSATPEEEELTPVEPMEEPRVEPPGDFLDTI